MTRQLVILAVIGLLTTSTMAMAQGTLTNLPFAGSDISSSGTYISGVDGFWTEADGVTAISDGHKGAISEGPLIIAGSTDVTIDSISGVKSASYWTEAGGWTEFGQFSWAQKCDYNLSSVWNMSDNGQHIAGHAYRADNTCRVHGYVYDVQTGLETRLPGIGLDSASAKDVSDDGTVIAGWERVDGLGRTPVVWDEFGTPTHIAPGLTGEATVVSADGSRVAGKLTEAGAFIWDATSGLLTIGMLPGYATAEPTGITEDGSMIVGGHILGGAPGLYDGWVWGETIGFVKLKDYLSSQGITQAATWDYTYVPHGVSSHGYDIIITQGLGNGYLVQIEAPVTVCELDFNEDGVVTQSDHYAISPTVDGIYYAAYTYLYKPNLFNTYFSHVDPAKLDWNKDGTITLEESMPNVPFSTETYYWQWFVYVYRSWIIDQYGTDYYALWWPESGCP